MRQVPWPTKDYVEMRSTPKSRMLAVVVPSTSANQACGNNSMQVDCPALFGLGKSGTLEGTYDAVRGWGLSIEDSSGTNDAVTKYGPPSLCGEL
jgi:hypothetical protein